LGLGFILIELNSPKKLNRCSTKYTKHRLSTWFHYLTFTREIWIRNTVQARRICKSRF